MARKKAENKKPTDKLADKTATTKFLQRVFGDAAKRTIKRLMKGVVLINAGAEKYAEMTDEGLREQVKAWQDDLLGFAEKSPKIANGERNPKVDELLPDVFALVREAATRSLGMRHFDVQLIGGMVLHEGNVAEMKTGEGKTLVATLPAVLNALEGKGVHIVTVNDYLAQRDGSWMAEVYHFLGLSVGVIINSASFIYDPEFENPDHDDEKMKHLKPATRKEAYNADITYGTNSEFGFDYLRDNMVRDTDSLRQRSLNYAIVDEVDSILIDEARTPLIISAPAADNPANYYKFAEIMKTITDEDYILDEKHRTVTLTDEGISKMEKALGVKNIYKPENVHYIYHLDQALRAETLFHKDKEYVVTRDGEVMIVDEHTGRLMAGRRYNEGLHQAIEAKEAVEVRQESMTLATISYQNFFRLYRKLSGMTGTAFTEEEEFHQIYKLAVVQIPSNKPITRVDKDDLIYRTEDAKIRAIVEKIKEHNKAGRPVLVGSASIVKNELIAGYLDKAKLPYEMLNAKNNEREAAIIAKAGEKKAITLATNMAGRGTDIKLGKGVVELGGLVVIGSERHESRRIDNQLRGRGGRQGDPGETQFFVSTEDDLMRIFQGDRIATVMTRMGLSDDMPISNKMISKILESAQKRVEGFNFDSRKNVVQYDNVISRHRKMIYSIRRKILDGDDMNKEIKQLIVRSAEILSEVPAKYNKHWWANFKELLLLGENEREKVMEIGAIKNEKIRKQKSLEYIKAIYYQKEDEFGAEIMRKIEREVYLQVMDTLWMQHLENMQYLREGIHWRSVGQRDPLVEYRSESQKLFDGLQTTLREQVLKLVLSVRKQEVAHLADDKLESDLIEAAKGNDKGVNEVSKEKKIGDKEFKEGEVIKKANRGGKNVGKKAKTSAKKGGKNKKKSKKR
ncbi:MAG: preprotein translocase subunit SecA [Candidatus Nomurabacteria bacterium]|nr:preprotein translocase subunit SecA [Candidatus Nomurabacteria bacterium]